MMVFVSVSVFMVKEYDGAIQFDQCTNTKCVSDHAQSLFVSKAETLSLIALSKSYHSIIITISLHCYELKYDEL